MKTLIYYWILISIMTCNCYSQSYIPMLTDSNKFNFMICFEGCEAVISKTVSDTSIGQLKYRYHIGTYYNGGQFHYDTLGLLREDTALKMVFMKRKLGNYQFSPEFILYDFSLKEGDSIKLLLPELMTPYLGYSIMDTLGYYTVDSIRNKETLSGIRKHIYLYKKTEVGSPTYAHMLWVEGVGVVYGNYLVSNYNSWLTCKFNDAENIYKGYFQFEMSFCDTGCICLGLNIKEANTKTSNIRLLSSKEALIIKSNDLMHNIKIVSANGQVIKDVICSTKEISIDIFTIVSGIYVANIELENGQFENHRFLISCSR